MAVIRAILWAQFRSMKFFGRGSPFLVVAGSIWYSLWVAGALAVGFAASVAAPAMLDQYVPLGLLGVLFYWQIIPVFSASMGSGLDLRKLLAYPVPHDRLFFIEVLLRFTTGIEPMMILTGGVIGIACNPALHGWIAEVRLSIAMLVYVAFNLLLASGLRSVLERLLSRRRVREMVAFLMAMIWVVPRLFVATGVHPKWLAPARAATGVVGWPWTAAARAGFSGDASQSAVLAAGSLTIWTLLAAWFGRWQFERSLRFDPQAAQATAGGPRRAAGIVERFYRFPALLWRDPVGGMVEKELRSLARTPRFRMVFVMGFTFGVILWLPMALDRGSEHGMSRYFLTIVCVYSLTLLGGVTYWNCFGFDRSAALFYFAAPLPMTQVLAAKNVAALIFVYLEVAILSAITVVLRIGIGPRQIAEALVVMGIAATNMLALGNVSSIQHPRALDPERVSQGGGTGFQGFVFLLYPLALLPIALAYLARYAFDSQMAFVLVLALAAAIAGILYKISLDSAVHAAVTRREELVAALSKSGGPVA